MYIYIYINLAYTHRYWSMNGIASRHTSMGMSVEYCNPIVRYVIRFKEETMQGDRQTIRFQL